MKKLLLILFSVLSLSTTIFAVDTNGKFNYAAGFVIGSTNGFNGLAYDGEGRGYQLTLSLKQNGDSKIGVAFDKLFFYDANDSSRFPACCCSHCATRDCCSAFSHIPSLVRRQMASSRRRTHSCSTR